MYSLSRNTPLRNPPPYSRARKVPLVMISILLKVHFVDSNKHPHIEWQFVTLVYGTSVMTAEERTSRFDNGWMMRYSLTLMHLRGDGGQNMPRVIQSINGSDDDVIHTIGRRSAGRHTTQRILPAPSSCTSTCFPRRDDYEECSEC